MCCRSKQLSIVNVVNLDGGRPCTAWYWSISLSKTLALRNNTRFNLRIHDHNTFFHFKVVSYIVWGHHQLVTIILYACTHLVISIQIQYNCTWDILIIHKNYIPHGIVHCMFWKHGQSINYSQNKLWFIHNNAVALCQSLTFSHSIVGFLLPCIQRNHHIIGSLCCCSLGSCR